MWFKYLKKVTTFLLLLNSFVSDVSGRATDDLETGLKRSDIQHVDFGEVDQHEPELAKREAMANEANAGTDGMTKCESAPGQAGPPGPDGPRGFRGRDGRDGREGPPGFNGFEGEVGYPGKDGEPGHIGLTGPRGQDAPDRGTSGTTYIRWGRTVCNADTSAELVYKGIAGGTFFNQKGGGTNYLCLPETPEYDSVQAGNQGGRGLVYSAEYETGDFNPLKTLNNHDVPCAVCAVYGHSLLLMIPAKMTCPEGWIREYHGYLMSEHSSHEHPTEFVCVDRDPEVRESSNADKNGALFHPVEGRCDANLPCGPYVNGNELSCVVCTK